MTPLLLQHWSLFLRPVLISLAVASGLWWAADTQASVRLTVPFHRQELSLSCEVATLKMALASHGVSVTETELIQKLSFDPTLKSQGVWGDPNQGFVGKIDGRMLIDGYGVYWDPLAELGQSYATTKVIKHGSPAVLARHLSQGNPVIIWGYYGQRGVYTWQSSVGQKIKAVNGEHTRIVYGFDGSVSQPTRFYLIDPLSGHLSWSTAELMYNWSALNHMGVVVGPPRTWVRISGQVDVWEIDEVANTRRLIATWDAFVKRGGTTTAIKNIAEPALLGYTRVSDIN